MTSAGKLAFVSVVALALVSAATSLFDSTAAHAAPPKPQALYGGGGVVASYAYRDLFDCWASSAGGALGLSTGSSCPLTGINPEVEVLYDPSGSGEGRAAYLADNPAFLHAPLSDYPPATSSDYPSLPYPRIHFAAAGVGLTASQIAMLNQAALGPALQVPSLVMPVVIAFNPASLTIVNTPPSGGTSGLRLTRDDLCGIFSGAIADWSDGRLSLDNGHQLLSSVPLPIKVVYPHASSDTAYLLSLALTTQCLTSAYPMPPAWGSAGGGFFVDNAAAGNLPANFIDASLLTVTGNNPTLEAEADALAATVGSVGFLSPEFAEPYGVPGHTALPTANLQNQAGIDSRIKRFVPPTPATTWAIVSYLAAPVAGDSAAIWGAKGVVANPDDNNAYPIGGFSWLYLYSCYSDPAVLKNLVGPGDAGLVRWLYGTDPNVPQILGNHGFAALPFTWKRAVRALLFVDSATKIRRGGGANAAFCSTGE